MMNNQIRSMFFLLCMLHLWMALADGIGGITGEHLQGNSSRYKKSLSFYSEDKRWKCPEPEWTLCFNKYYYDCNSHSDCSEKKMCCLTTCIYQCVRPIPIRKVAVDGYEYYESVDTYELDSFDNEISDDFKYRRKPSNKEKEVRMESISKENEIDNFVYRANPVNDKPDIMLPNNSFQGILQSTTFDSSPNVTTSATSTLSAFNKSKSEASTLTKQTPESNITDEDAGDAKNFHGIFQLMTLDAFPNMTASASPQLSIPTTTISSLSIPTLTELTTGTKPRNFHGIFQLRTLDAFPNMSTSATPQNSIPTITISSLSVPTLTELTTGTKPRNFHGIFQLMTLDAFPNMTTSVTPQLSIPTTTISSLSIPTLTELVTTGNNSNLHTLTQELDIISKPSNVTQNFHGIIHLITLHDFPNDTTPAKSQFGVVHSGSMPATVTSSFRGKSEVTIKKEISFRGRNTSESFTDFPITDNQNTETINELVTEMLPLKSIVQEKNNSFIQVTSENKRTNTVMLDSSFDHTNIKYKCHDHFEGKCNPISNFSTKDFALSEENFIKDYQDKKVKHLLKFQRKNYLKKYMEYVKEKENKTKNHYSTKNKFISTSSPVVNFYELTTSIRPTAYNNSKYHSKILLRKKVTDNKEKKTKHLMEFRRKNYLKNQMEAKRKISRKHQSTKKKFRKISSPLNFYESTTNAILATHNKSKYYTKIFLRKKITDVQEKKRKHLMEFRRKNYLKNYMEEKKNKTKEHHSMKDKYIKISSPIVNFYKSTTNVLPTANNESKYYSKILLRKKIADKQEKKTKHLMEFRRKNYLKNYMEEKENKSKEHHSTKNKFLTTSSSIINSYESTTNALSTAHNESKYYSKILLRKKIADKQEKKTKHLMEFRRKNYLKNYMEEKENKSKEHHSTKNKFLTTSSSIINSYESTTNALSTAHNESKYYSKILLRKKIADEQEKKTKHLMEYRRKNYLKNYMEEKENKTKEHHSTKNIFAKMSSPILDFYKSTTNVLPMAYNESKYYSKVLLRKKIADEQEKKTKHTTEYRRKNYLKNYMEEKENETKEHHSTKNMFTKMSSPVVNSYESTTNVLPTTHNESKYYSKVLLRKKIAEEQEKKTKQLMEYRRKNYLKSYMEEKENKTKEHHSTGNIFAKMSSPILDFYELTSNKIHATSNEIKNVSKVSLRRNQILTTENFEHETIEEKSPIVYSKTTQKFFNNIETENMYNNSFAKDLNTEVVLSSIPVTKQYDVLENRLDETLRQDDIDSDLDKETWKNLLLNIVKSEKENALDSNLTSKMISKEEGIISGGTADNMWNLLQPGVNWRSQYNVDKGNKSISEVLSSSEKTANIGIDKNFTHTPIILKTTLHPQQEEGFPNYESQELKKFETTRKPFVPRYISNDTTKKMEMSLSYELPENTEFQELNPNESKQKVLFSDPLDATKEELKELNEIELEHSFPINQDGELSVNDSKNFFIDLPNMERLKSAGEETKIAYRHHSKENGNNDSYNEIKNEFNNNNNNKEYLSIFNMKTFTKSYQFAKQTNKFDSHGEETILSEFQKDNENTRQKYLEKTNNENLIKSLKSNLNWYKTENVETYSNNTKLKQESALKDEIDLNNLFQNIINEELSFNESSKQKNNENTGRKDKEETNNEILVTSEEFDFKENHTYNVNIYNNSTKLKQESTSKDEIDLADFFENVRNEELSFNENNGQSDKNVRKNDTEQINNEILVTSKKCDLNGNEIKNVKICINNTKLKQRPASKDEVDLDDLFQNVINEELSFNVNNGHKDIKSEQINNESLVKRGKSDFEDNQTKNLKAHNNNFKLKQESATKDEADLNELLQNVINEELSFNMNNKQKDSKNTGKK